ncbi:MAG: 50S ribosomal protein L30e [Acidilobus sp.]
MSERAALERELKAVMKTGKVVLGAKKSLTMLLRNRLKGLIIADNSAKEVRRALEETARINGTPITVFKGTSSELGSVIGKPFKISAIGIIDPGDSRILDLLSGS